jgi:hypothetical protein
VGLQPRIVATLLVRDEAEIVAACVEHLLGHGVDRIVATDNGSEDATRAILARYPEVAEVLDEPGRDYDQAAWLTRMARRAHALWPGAAWVVHADADEFYLGLPSLLALPGDCAAACLSRYRDFLPAEAAGPGPFERALYRDYLAGNVMLSGPLPSADPAALAPWERPALHAFRLAHRPAPDIYVGQGAHFVSGLSGRWAQAHFVHVDHYPVRHRAHFERKARQGGEAYARYKGPAADGWHWRAWHAALPEGRAAEAYAALCPPEPLRAQLRAAGVLGTVP